MTYEDARYSTGASPMYNGTSKPFITGDPWVNTWKNLGSLKVGASTIVSQVYVYL